VVVSGRVGLAGLSGFSTVVLGSCPLGLGDQVVAMRGGPVAADHSDCQSGAHGHWAGRCRTRRRPVAAIRAGTLKILVRTVAQRDLCWPAATAVALARLNAITAQATQAALAA
jgi:hypothetical protein